MSRTQLKHDYYKIYERHLNGETISKISKETGIHIQTIYSHFQRNKWKYNKNIQIRESKYWVNDSYLDNIDSEDKAYFLGWMLSDGCVINNKLKLKLKQSDEYIIVEMFNKFSSGYTISIDKNSRSMSLSSTKLIAALKKLGCVENKTEVGFNLPDIQQDIFRHFVRGYFEGDGSIGIISARTNEIQVNVCSIDNNFLIELQNKLFEYNIKSEVYKEIRKGKNLKQPNGEYSTNNQNMFRLIVQTHQEKLKFYEFLYNDCNIKLIRKYDKYKEYYNNTVLMLNTKNSLEEVNKRIILDLHGKGVCEYGIHKETKIGRGVIKRILSKL